MLGSCACTECPPSLLAWSGVEHGVGASHEYAAQTLPQPTHRPLPPHPPDRTRAAPCLAQTAPGRYNEAALRGLDYLLDEARKAGIRVRVSARLLLGRGVPLQEGQRCLACPGGWCPLGSLAPRRVRRLLPPRSYLHTPALPAPSSSWHLQATGLPQAACLSISSGAAPQSRHAQGRAPPVPARWGTAASWAVQGAVRRRCQLPGSAHQRPDRWCRLAVLLPSNCLPAFWTTYWFCLSAPSLLGRLLH